MHVADVLHRLVTADAAKVVDPAAAASVLQLHRQKARVRKTVLRPLAQSVASRLTSKRLRPRRLAASLLRRRLGPRVTVSGPSGGPAAAMNLAATSLAVIGHTVIGTGRRAEWQRASQQ